MAEFSYKTHATFSPTRCLVCSDHAGPFIDCHSELYGHGRVYICASTADRPGCVQQMARLDGMVLAAEVEEDVVALRDAIASLEEQLELAISEKVVPLDEVLSALSHYAAPVAAGKESRAAS
jgi:hypothetical protein